VDPIVVPAPPRSSYNPNRPVSDLIASQIKFFQHIELKRGDLGVDPKIGGNIHTEAGAAQYIGAVTRALRSKSPVAAAAPKPTILSRTKSAKKPPSAEPLSSAAGASETTSAAPTKTPVKKGAKQSSTKPIPKAGAGNNKGKR
jgi:hypothetical protein